MAMLYDEYYRPLFEWILPRIVPPTQTYVKRSKIGYPVLAIKEDKLNTLLPYFLRLLEGNTKDIEGGFTIINVRLQPEPLSKKRDFLFVTEEGKIYEQKIEAKDRYKAREGRFSSRTRDVFNENVANLLKQILDTAIHNAFLSFPAYHHNMSAQAHRRMMGYKRGFDIKHFERFAGYGVLYRASILGGLYYTLQKIISGQPFAMPTDNWQRCALVRPLPGWQVQLGSGDSSVAPIGKETLTMLFAKFLKRVKKLDPIKAFFAIANMALTGDFVVWNYGDDNAVFGDKGLIDEFFAFASEYMHIEEEKPLKFLGYEYSEEEGWVLSRKSYLLKWYLHERAPLSNFRPYPFLGRMKRREVYRKQGERMIVEQIFPYEDVLLAKFGYPPYRLTEKGMAEEKLQPTGSVELNDKYVLEKDYQLTDEEKAADTEHYDYLPPHVTSKWMAILLDKKWR